MCWVVTLKKHHKNSWLALRVRLDASGVKLELFAIMQNINFEKLYNCH